MDYVDRSVLAQYRDPARLERSQYVHCLLKRLANWLSGAEAGPRTAPCG
jgi:hypothetical protein